MHDNLEHHKERPLAKKNGWKDGKNHFIPRNRAKTEEGEKRSTVKNLKICATASLEKNLVINRKEKAEPVAGCQKA